MFKHDTDRETTQSTNYFQTYEGAARDKSSVSKKITCGQSFKNPFKIRLFSKTFQPFKGPKVYTKDDTNMNFQMSK